MARTVKPRFFVFLTLLLCLIAFVVYKLTVHTVKVDTIFTSNSEQTETMDCVIVRDEKVLSSASTVRVEFIAAEDTLVSEGDEIARLYATGYTQSLLQKLETTRESIQEYHKQLLGTIRDSSLERLDQIVNMTAEEFRNVATGITHGNLRFTMQQLQTSMSNRQEYLRQNKRDDTKLTKLYDEENSRKTAIETWRTVSTAEQEGVLSFYLDGYENDLTPATITHLSTDDLRTVLRGGELSTTADTKKNGIYRIVDQDKWYVAVLSDSASWNPVVGQDYYLQIKGYDDLVFRASVTNAQKTNGTMLAMFEINEPIGPLIYARTGEAELSISITSMAVHAKALATVNGEQGVWLYDTPGGTFVPVEVLSKNGEVALIQPKVEGALESGQKVLIK